MEKASWSSSSPEGVMRKPRGGSAVIKIEAAKNRVKGGVVREAWVPGN